MTELSLVSNRGCLDAPSPRLGTGVGPLFELNNQKRAVEICADDKLQNQRELGYKLSISSLNELEILFLSIESIVTESVQTLLVNSSLFIYRCLCSFNFSITIFALAFTGHCKLRQRCHKSTLFLLLLFFLGAFVWYMIRRCAAQEHTLLREKRDKSLSISCCETVMYHFMQRATNLSPDWFGDGFSEYCTSLCGLRPLGVMKYCPLKFLTARKILPLLDLLAKFKRVFACSCSQNFCSCSHARLLVSIARNFVNPSLK